MSFPPTSRFSSCRGWWMSPTKWTMNFKASRICSAGREEDWTRVVWRRRGG